ncbi:hypothetical protein SFRURICE_007931, partial [Spodoptera frugiperda]
EAPVTSQIVSSSVSDIILSRPYLWWSDDSLWRDQSIKSLTANTKLLKANPPLTSMPDLQFPIDVSGVQNDHPFLDADSLQSLFRRLTALNRCANMKLEHHHHQKRSYSIKKLKNRSKPKYFGTTQVIS